MVSFDFKLTEGGKVDFPLSAPEKLDTVVKQCAAGEGLSLGGYIAVRNGKVITGDTLVAAGDSVDIFPAISGG